MGAPGSVGFLPAQSLSPCGDLSPMAAADDVSSKERTNPDPIAPPPAPPQHYQPISVRYPSTHRQVLVPEWGGNAGRKSINQNAIKVRMNGRG